MVIWILHVLPPHRGFSSFIGRLGIYSLFVGKIPTKRRKCGYTERIISYIPNYPKNTLGCALIWGISRHFSLIYPIVSLHILHEIRADTHFIHVHLLFPITYSHCNNIVQPKYPDNHFPVIYCLLVHRILFFLLIDEPFQQSYHV